MQRAARSAPRAIAAGLAALIGLAPVRAAHAGFIDLGSADFFELVGIDVTVANQQVYASQLVGSSPDLPETVSDSYSGFGGTANVVATTAAGTPGVAPSLDLSANATDSASVQAIASVSFEATLIKLHPDAPDDIPIPILFSSALSGIAQLDIGQNGTSLISEQALEIGRAHV